VVVLLKDLLIFKNAFQIQNSLYPSSAQALQTYCWRVQKSLPVNTMENSDPSSTELNFAQLQHLSISLGVRWEKTVIYNKVFIIRNPHINYQVFLKQSGNHTKNNLQSGVAGLCS
jgi:hypothetical protein